MNHRCLPERAKHQGPDGHKALMNATKIKDIVTAKLLGKSEAVFNLGDNEGLRFMEGQWKAMNGKVSLELFKGRKLPVRIACYHMDAMSSFAKLKAEVIRDPASAPYRVRKEHIC
jgi:hypothetical protein